MGNVASAGAGRKYLRSLCDGEFRQRVLCVDPNSGGRLARREDIRIRRLVIAQQKAFRRISMQSLEAIKVLPDAIAAERREGGDAGGKGGQRRLRAEGVKRDFDIGMRECKNLYDRFDVRTNAVISHY